jgi:hypothetical protein
LKKLKILGKLTVVLLCIIYLLPFAIITFSDSAALHVNRAVSFLLIAQKLKTKSADQTEMALNIYDYVREMINPPLQTEFINELHPFEVLKKGTGSCDQQAHVIIFIAQAAGLEGRMVFLYGQDGISRHTVTELKINDKWAMLDPYYAYYFKSDGRILGVAEIADKKVVIDDGKNIDGATYTSYFNTNYPAKIHPLKKEKGKASIFNAYLRFMYKISPAPYMKMLQSFSDR